MNYNCRHCKTNLDKGDMYEVLLYRFRGDSETALREAKRYGWTEANRKHYTHEMIIYPLNGNKYTVCPHCNGRDPLPAGF